MNRAVFKYFGGKWHIAPWITSHFPEHQIYIEPYCGAASILMRKKRCYAETINDQNEEITNLFEILRDKNQKEILKEKLKYTPYARAEYDKAFKKTRDKIENARRFMIRSMMGYHADSVITENCKSGFENDFNRKYTIPAHTWGTHSEYLDKFTDRLQGVIIEKKDAIKIMEKNSKQENILWYLDPPYPAKTRTAANKHKYAFEMTDEQHEELIKLILEIKGMAIISSYENPIYKKLETFGWKKETKTYKNHTYNAGERTECIWINPQAQEKKKNPTAIQETFNF